jgi:hypothetical protein
VSEIRRHGSGAEVRLRPEDAVAHVREVVRGCSAHEEAALDFDGVTDRGVLADDGRAPDVGVRTDGRAATNEDRSLDDHAGVDGRVGFDDDVATERRARVHLAGHLALDRFQRPLVGLEEVPRVPPKRRTLHRRRRRRRSAA